jgi:hypothetical protein
VIDVEVHAFLELKYYASLEQCFGVASSRMVTINKPCLSFKDKKGNMLVVEFLNVHSHDLKKLQ